MRSVPARSGRAGHGFVWLGLALLAGGVAFQDGFVALVRAWGLVEYSHGPLIPVISLCLFLRQLRDLPPARGPVTDRWPGVAVVVASLLLGLVGAASGIEEIVTYAIILWIGGLVLTSFGWARGRRFWPPVLHLVFMLPLPGVIYYKTTALLQLLSSEIGVWFIRAAGIPVLLEGNIITLDAWKLHVAEACSGLRYLFPVMSFTYVFAVLYRGSLGHKAVLLLAAVPITVLMNAVRVGATGVIVDGWGPDRADGFLHLFEGWVVFGLTILGMIGLSGAMQRLAGDRRGALAALDLDLSGIAGQIARAGDIRGSGAWIAGLAAAGLAGSAVLAVPRLMPPSEPVRHEPLILFPADLGRWRSTGMETLEPGVRAALGADDYLSVTLAAAGEAAPVQLFVAWYRDQRSGGIHSPEICIPGSGWEIAGIGPRDVTLPAPDGGTGTVRLNRALIQQGTSRQLVWYWFDQRGNRFASDYRAKVQLVLDGMLTGRTDGALVRLVTPIRPGEAEAAAAARLASALAEVMPHLPRHIGTVWPGPPASR